ncbi:hypothetical protein BU26DRAFT_519867 [Trematosphaeria pertusa]|uniref:Uncharacterized protein n=1 Tax=Trematosphaeria pertusa TaxID=390896 RepID=A0A6A6IF16_9PLEO|nr:uncharacterized protein BU26DRAFT_519867 [Trematosphaeria pertusa]KAF2248130.1 hypothetical protein BU26DRAFT_519867 [Trematosphaeria pertusa]
MGTVWLWCAWLTICSPLVSPVCFRSNRYEFGSRKECCMLTLQKLVSNLHRPS